MQHRTHESRVRFLTRLAVCIAMSLAASAHAQLEEVRFVDQAATGVPDGLSWPTAYRNLSPALAEAAADPSITEIWVAAATYTPGPTGARGATFQIPLRLGSTLSLFGGFLGNAHPGGGGGGAGPAALESALATMGFANVAELQAHVTAVSDAEAFACGCVLEVLLSTQP